MWWTPPSRSLGVGVQSLKRMEETEEAADGVMAAHVPALNLGVAFPYAS